MPLVAALHDEPAGGGRLWVIFPRSRTLVAVATPEKAQQADDFTKTLPPDLQHVTSPPGMMRAVISTRPEDLCQKVPCL